MTNFMWFKPLQRLITPTVGVPSLIRIVFQDDLSLIGG